MSWNQDRLTGFWYGFLGGMGIAVLGFGWYFTHFIHRLQAIDRLREQTQASGEASYKDLLALARQCRDDAEARAHESTVLIDPMARASSIGIPLLGGLAEIRPGPALDARPNSNDWAANVRWFLPGKITPVIYGELSGAQYYHWDSRSRRLEGPYLPEQPGK